MTIFKDTRPFAPYASPGDAITAEHDGFTVTATIHYDDNAEPPWERGDMHGVVIENQRLEPGDELPEGMRILHRERYNVTYYDIEASQVRALKDGWGYDGSQADKDAGATPEDIALKAVKQDFEFLRAWCADEWHYVGIAVTVAKNGIVLTGPYDHATWGVENTETEYLVELADESAHDALADAKQKLIELLK